MMELMSIEEEMDDNETKCKMQFKSPRNTTYCKDGIGLCHPEWREWRTKAVLRMPLPLQREGCH